MYRNNLSDEMIYLQSLDDILLHSLSFMEKSADGIFLVNEQGHIIFWNTAMENIFAIKASEALRLKAWELHNLLQNTSMKSRKTIERIHASIIEATLSGQANWMNETIERRIFCRDKKQRQVQFRFFPIDTQRGFMIGCIARDIGEEVKREADITEKPRRLHQYNNINIINFNEKSGY